MKKFYDIFPPEFHPAPFVDKRYGIEKPKKSSTFSLKLFFLILAIFIIFGGIYASFKFTTLDLEIWPETERFIKEEKILATLDASEIDISNKIIPANLFEEEKKMWQLFPATDTEFQEEKAKGKIRVFNKSEKALSLIKESRFLSEQDKTFICPKPIFIPGNSYVDVEVVAIEAGKDYNIGPSDFSIPGLKGTERYFTTSGKSFEPMKGGSGEEIKKVSQEDLENAKNFLTEKIFSDLQNSLKEKSFPEFILFDEAVLKEIVDIFFPVKAGMEFEKFNASAEGKVKAIVFRESDLESLLKELLFSEIEFGKKVFLESLLIDYELKSVDFKNNRIEIDAKISAKIYQDIDEKSIKNEILKRGKNQIKEIILENFPKISKIEMKFHPFWINRAPVDPERIKIYWKED